MKTKNNISMLFALLTVFILTVEAGDADPIVETAYGKFRGKILESVNNNSFFSFQAIPYAKPPVGELRFKPPQRPDYWAGILDDRNSYKECIQISSNWSTDQTEDCLYLNVYTPQLPTKDQNKSLPVLVFIHGGAFVFGSARIQEFGPQFLMDYDIVVVTLQYRLGFFGFLSTEDLVCPGNNGFKDQQFALRWVKDNIRNFGGDSDKITIWGQSAGGGSVGYQLLGSNATGLFRGAIQTSGTSLGAWTLTRNPRKLAYYFGNYINSTINEKNTTTEELLAFFRTVEPSLVAKACVEIFGEGMVGGFYPTFTGFVFAGVVEPEHEGAFLTETAYSKFQSGKFNVVPLLIGINDEEAKFLLNDTNFHKRMALYDAQTELLVSPDMHLTDLNTTKKVGQYIREIYVGPGRFQDNLGPSIRYFSDGAFGRPMIRQAKLISNYTKVYFYEFAFAGEMSHQPHHLNIPGAGEVAHTEQMSYLFQNTMTGDLSQYPPADITTMKRMLTLWTNFVKYLNPTPEPVELLQNVTWPYIESTSKMPYLLINDTLEVKYNLKKSMEDAYNRLYDTFAIPPLDTY